MKRNLIILIVSTLFILTGCFGLFDSGSDRITGKYIVMWIDIHENQGIYEEIDLNSSSSTGIVSEYVYSVGHNEEFIIAKQHPTSGFENGFQIDTSVTNYFIVDMNRKVLKKGNKAFGPLTKPAFDSLSIVLNIENIEFDMNYPHFYE